MVLMQFVGVFTRSMEDDCLVLDVAKYKLLARSIKVMIPKIMPQVIVVRKFILNK